MTVVIYALDSHHQPDQRDRKRSKLRRMRRKEGKKPSRSARTAEIRKEQNRTAMIFHHVLPLSLPTILTGVIIGLAQALGETAPLLLIGMVAFVGNVPLSVFDPATALPVQIYSWANEVERGFVERTSAAIIVLLLFLAIMNITAIFLRRRFEKRW